MYEQCVDLLAIPDINDWADSAIDANKRKFLIDNMSLKERIRALTEYNWKSLFIAPMDCIFKPTEYVNNRIQAYIQGEAVNKVVNSLSHSDGTIRPTTTQLALYIFSKVARDFDHSR